MQKKSKQFKVALMADAEVLIRNDEEGDGIQVVCSSDYKISRIRTPFCQTRQRRNRKKATLNDSFKD